MPELVRAPSSTTAPPTVREHITALLNRGMYTQAEIAHDINYSASTLSSWLAGKYSARAQKLEVALHHWLRRKGEVQSADDVPTQFIETTPARQCMDTIDIAHELGVITAVVGPPGCGKTEGRIQWERLARASKIRFVSVTCHVGMTSHVPVLRKICDQLRLQRTGSAPELMDRICDTLKSDPAIVIVDEAQHLGVSALEALRAINDETKTTGIALLGSMWLYRTLHDGDRKHIELSQLQDRIHVIQKLNVLSNPELKRFATQLWAKPIEDDCIARLKVHSHSVPRRLVRILMHARQICEDGHEQLNPRIIDEAALLLFRKEAA